MISLLLEEESNGAFQASLTEYPTSNSIGNADAFPSLMNFR